MNANLFALLRTHWSVAPNRDFLIPASGKAVTYEEMDQRSGRLAAQLRAEGVQPGDRVVVQVEKSIDNVALYLATLRVGAVYVPLNTSYTEHEVEFFLADAQPQVVVRTDTLERFVEAAESQTPWEGCAPRLADDIAALVYTSGTTGRSKGAMLTHSNLVSNALTLHSFWRFVPGDVLLHVLPIYHVHGLFVALHTAMLNASSVLFCERFHVDTVLRWLPEASVMMGVPTHYIRLLGDDRFTADVTRNVRLFTSGSAPMTEQLHARFTDRSGHQILERYGMSEAGMITSNPYDGDRVPGTVGYSLPGVSIRVMGSEGPCGAGEVGTVQVKGPNVFAGYWRLPDRTEESHDGEWFVTGDVGFVDETGRLTLEGRSSDMIISGGLNVYPREIELVLDQHAGVLETAVVGIADEDLGERVEAFVVAKPTASVDLSALEAAARQRLAGFKIPKAFHVLSELPRNSMGKVQKVVLREQYQRKS